MYADWTGTGACNLLTVDAEMEAFELSLKSWKEHGQKITRCLYADPVICGEIEKNGLSKFLDEIIPVDFKYELDTVLKTPFWTFPKIWAMLKQKEPFFIVDTETVLIEDLGDDYFFSEKEAKKTVKGILSLYNQSLSEDNKVLYKKYIDTATIGNFFSLDRILYGACIFYPDPDIAKAIASLVLLNARELGEFEIKNERVFDDCIFYEEGALAAACKLLDIDIEPLDVFKHLFIN